MDTIKVTINFQYIHPKYGEYWDTLNIPYDDYQGMSQEDIDALKQARVDAWVDGLSNPPIAQVETAEVLQEQVASIDEQIATLEAQKTEIQSKL